MVPEDLERQGYAVSPGFLSLATCDALIAEIDRLDAAGALDRAGVGTGAHHQIAPDVRSDLIHWLDETNLSAASRTAWDELEALRITLNRTLFLGLRRFEGHLTRYPPGARYEKHVDNFAGTSARVVSCIIYLNRDWHAQDGGELRLYRRDDPDMIERDVAPEAGTMACFLSREMPHEVMATKRARYSLTGWFRTD